eukprot:10553449-Alexandrium_andersonii.AAC.1
MAVFSRGLPFSGGSIYGPSQPSQRKIRDTFVVFSCSSSRSAGRRSPRRARTYATKVELVSCCKAPAGA